MPLGLREQLGCFVQATLAAPELGQPYDAFRCHRGSAACENLYGVLEFGFGVFPRPTPQTSS